MTDHERKIVSDIFRAGADAYNCDSEPWWPWGIIHLLLPFAAFGIMAGGSWLAWWLSC